MEMPELSRRIYTLGEWPPAVHSISYHTCWTLHAALKKALHDDEYEELKESNLGVFIKFQELGFDWASRLVHYMFGFQLNIKKKYELWSLVGPEPVSFSLLEFENLTGLNCEYIEDLERPHSVVTKELTSFWEMLGIHVEAGPSTQEIMAALERCEGWSRDDRKWLAYLAIFTGYIEGRKYSTPTRVSLARLVMELERFENYPWGRVAFKVWVYTALLELGATFGNPLPNNPSPPILAYKGRKGRIQFKEDILSQDIADAMREGFETCLKEIKYLSERVEAVEKKVGITTKRKGTSSQNTTSPPKPTLEPGSESVNGTNAGRKSLAEDKGPDVPAAVPANGSSSKDKAPEPSLQSPYTANSTTRELADWLKTCPHYRTTLDKKPLVYVEDLPRMCFLDHLFAQQWRFNFKDFKDSEPNQNGLGRRLPVNFADTHWIAMWISIPKRHIVVFDSICSSISPEELDVVMQPLLYMVPYLLVECASSDEQRAQYSLVPFTYERPTNIPPARAGDCGVYTLKARPSQICLVVQFDKEVKLVR
uniref:Ubiquitin-like protease family profile domain-containing protein n=1 Tax=Brassica oleracea TaxID=3712 RepID=A0A3P6EVS1_BRAOL|nr:unnamed protein product [Brassica oleracea]